MDLKLKGKLALVTGSTAGIGKGVAQLLLQEGAAVVINGRHPEILQQTADELSVFGTCYTACGNLATKEGAQAITDAIDAIGCLDILVGNMGAYKGSLGRYHR